jgi:hypothetical protein
VADTTVEDFDHDFGGAGIAASEVEWSKRRLYIESGIPFG